MSLKSELKNGAVVECRNGHRFIKIDNTLIGIESMMYLPLDSYSDDLIDADEGWDIVKINNSTENGRGYCNWAICEVYKRNKWTWEKPKEILDKAEKEYLSAVIKPFRDEVKYITKRNFFNSHDKYDIRIDLIDDFMNLPYFKSNKMYKAMQVDKEYTLEELGL